MCVCVWVFEMFCSAQRNFIDKFFSSCQFWLMSIYFFFFFVFYSLVLIQFELMNLLRMHIPFIHNFNKLDEEVNIISKYMCKLCITSRFKKNKANKTQTTINLLRQHLERSNRNSFGVAKFVTSSDYLCEIALILFVTFS